MTVKELIEELQKHDQTIDVKYADLRTSSYSSSPPDLDIEEVSLENPDEGVVYVRLY